MRRHTLDLDICFAASSLSDYSHASHPIAQFENFDHELGDCMSTAVTLCMASRIALVGWMQITLGLAPVISIPYERGYKSQRMPSGFPTSYLGSSTRDSVGILQIPPLGCFPGRHRGLKALQTQVQAEEPETTAYFVLTTHPFKITQAWSEKTRVWFVAPHREELDVLKKQLHF